MWRLYQLEKHLSDPTHPYHKFSTGSLETLWETPRRLGIDVRQGLLDFHAKYYSANLMALAVLGRGPRRPPPPPPSATPAEEAL